MSIKLGLSSHSRSKNLHKAISASIEPFDHVPQELWVKILLNLPVKSLLQCSSVCKQWYSLVTSPSLIDTHLSASLRRPHLLTPDQTDWKNHFFVTVQTDPFDPSRNLRLPFPGRIADNENSVLLYRVVGSIHGLVCLSDDIVGGYTTIIIIWNPFIRKSFQLPIPLFNFFTVGPFYFTVGFGFDSANNDYKVVRIVYKCESDLFLPPLVEVFSIKEGSWRKVRADHVKHFIPEGSWTQVFIHGSSHWLAYKDLEHSPGFENAILCFDVGSELFSTMMLPESALYTDPRMSTLSVIRGLLSVFIGSTLWIQREYGEVNSWTMVVTLDRKPDLGVVLQCRRELVEGMLKSTGGVMAFDSQDLDLQLPEPSGYFTEEPFFVFSYTESLVMLDEERWCKEEGIYMPKKAWSKVQPRRYRVRINRLLKPTRTGIKMLPRRRKLKIVKLRKAERKKLQGNTNNLRRKRWAGED